MSYQTNACVLTHKLIEGAGKALLARHTGTNVEVWIHQDLEGNYLPYPRNAFSNITDFHDYIKYRHTENPYGKKRPNKRNVR